MKNIKRIAAIVLCLVFVVLSFSSCKSKTNTQISTDDSRIVLTLGGMGVPYDFYRYLFLNTMDELGITPETLDENYGLVKENVLVSLEKTYAVFALAEEYNIILSSDEKDEIKVFFSEAKGTMSKDEYQKSLEESHLTEEVAEFAYGIQYLENKVYSELVFEANNYIKADDDTFEAALNTDFVRVQQIMISYNESNTDKKAELANEVADKIKAGEDFDELRLAYSEDNSTSGGEEGYYFTHGEFDPNFEEAAFSLSEGEVSQIIVTSDAFHFLRRMPLEEDYIERNFESLRQEYMTGQYYLLKEEKIASLISSVEYAENYDSLDFVNNK